MNRRAIKRIAAMVAPHFEEAWRRHPDDHRVAYQAAWRRFADSAASLVIHPLCNDSGALGEAAYRAIRREVLAAFGLATIEQTMGEAVKLPRRRRRRRRPLPMTPNGLWMPGPGVDGVTQHDCVIALAGLLHANPAANVIDVFCRANRLERQEMTAHMATHCHVALATQ